MSKTARQQAKDIQGAGLWNTLGLVQVLVAACRIAESEPATDESADIGRRAMEILDKAAALAPELVLRALQKLPVSSSSWDPLTSQTRPPSTVASMHSRLLAMYLSSAPSAVTSSQLVFHEMWRSSPDSLLGILLNFYDEDENNLGRVLEISLELQVGDW